MSTSASAASSSRKRPRDRKQQILVAARDLFVEQGFPNVTMAQIAERVGITAGALYRHVSTKSMLLEQVVAENFAWVDDPIAETDYGSMIEEALARIVDRPYLSDLWTHEIRYLPSGERSRLRTRMRAWNRSLVPALARERPDLDAGQQELLAWAMQSLMSCVGRRAMRSPTAARLTGVRAGLRALVATPLVPTDDRVAESRPRLAPVSMRERLLMVAHEQFGERGYQETSMASLGAAAGVTGPNLYSYFDSKADLLRAVLERGTHSLWLSLNDVLAASPTAAEALPRLVRSYIRDSGSWASILEDPTGEFALDGAATATQREYVAEWVALLREALPELEPMEARLRVQLALFLVADLHRNARVASLRSFQENLAGVVLTVLFDGQTPDRCGG